MNHSLGGFLNRLHSVPKDALDEAGVSPSGAVRTRDDWVAFHEQLEGVLFPHLWRHQRRWVNDRFAPVLRDELTTEVGVGRVSLDLEELIVGRTCALRS